MSRVEARRDFDDGTRLRLVEGDLDKMDAELVEIRKVLNKILWAVVGLLISVTTASILLVLNLAGG